ncbi:MAG: replicative DNA helicase [Bacilli bacterium]|nr:replicative DNA helicase [Bacilli bacterium]
MSPARKSQTKKVTTELPYNLDAERVVLGCAMLNKDYCLDILNTLEEEDFFAGKHQIMFRAIASLAVRGIDVDVLTVAEELANLKELENIGGAKYLAECTNTVVAASTLDFYIRIIQDNSVLRKMLNTIRSIDEEYRTEEIENINDFILDSENRFKESISKRHISSFVTTEEISHIVEDSLEKLQDADNDSDVIGVSTGYERLNQITQGFKPGELIVVAARPAVGKTALCLNFAHKIATHSKKAVAIFSLEMSKEQLFGRLIAMDSCVDAKKINSGRFTSATEKVRVLNSIRTLANSKIYIDDTPSIKLNDIITKSTKLQAHEPDLALIVVDYLGLVSVASKNGRSPDSRQEEVRQISLALKALARDLKVPVIAVSQLSRAVEKRDSQRPVMSDLRDSGNIEQDADIVILLFREDYYADKKTTSAANKKGGQLTPNDKYELAKAQREKELGSEIPGNASYTEVIVAKNRAGSTGVARLFFYKDYVRFDSPSKEWEDAINAINEEN